MSHTITAPASIVTRQDMIDLTHALANELGLDVRITENTYSPDFYLVGKIEGKQVTLRMTKKSNALVTNTQVTILGLTDRPDEYRTLVSHIPTPSINVGVARGVETMAKDIRRRLLPPLFEAQRETDRLIAQRQETETTTAQRRNEIARIFTGCRIDDLSSDDHVNMTAYVDNTSAKVDATSGIVKVSGMTYDQTLALSRFIAENFQ